MAAPIVFERLLSYWRGAFASPLWPLIAEAWYRHDLASQLDPDCATPADQRLRYPWLDRRPQAVKNG